MTGFNLRIAVLWLLFLPLFACDSRDTDESAGSVKRSGPAVESALVSFIRRSGDILYDDVNGNGVQDPDEPPFRFISYNCTDFVLFQFDSWRVPDPWEQEEVFKTVRDTGGLVIRIFPFSVGSSQSSFRHCVTAPGEFGEEAFRVIDKLLELANRYGIRLILPFVDRYSSWGGIAEYAAFRGLSEQHFYTDARVRADFKKTISYVVNRTNHYTGVRYRDDRAILAWETGNELTADPWTNYYPWVCDIAGYIKSLDANHLVIDGFYGVNPTSLYDANIDIVSNHYYPDSALDYVLRCARDREASRGKKAFIVGEFGLRTCEGGANTKIFQDLLDAVIANGTTGALIWSLQVPGVKGGYPWHLQQNPLHFIWPGSPAHEAYDEIGTVNMLRERAFQIRGLPTPALEPPEAPVLLPITRVDRITWRHAHRAESYSLERSTAVDGPFTVIASGLLNHSTHDPAFCDTTATAGTPYYYRLKAVNAAGSSPYSEPVGPVTAALPP